MTDNFNNHASEHYINDLFAAEDEALRFAREETARQGMPQIQIQPADGRLLHLLARACGAQRIVEIGTLGGYSGIWLARALPPQGRLYTLELEAKHAEVARRSFARAGVADRVDVIVGPALDNLASLSQDAPYDMVFIDADKGTYPAYLDWAMAHVRPGGIITAHNALRDGKVAAPQSDADRVVDGFNRTAAQDPRLEATIVAIGDGMLFAVVR